MAGQVTWRLVVPQEWGNRGDPSWLPAVSGEAWRRIFAVEDMAGQTLRDGAATLPWRVASESSALLARVLEQYRLQLRVAEDVAAGCVQSEEHLAALRAAGGGAEPPRRTHPAGPWRTCAWYDGAVVHVSDHAWVDGAEGDAAARRTGDPRLICWAEPGRGERATAASPPPGMGWQPRVDRPTRLAAFAVEDTVASVCAAPGLGLTGPDLLDVNLLCLLGDASWRCIREYRTLLAGIWTDLERCPHTDAHEADAAAEMKSIEEAEDAVPSRPWRHLQLLNGRALERSVHDSWGNAAASVAVARVVDDDAIHWCAPVG